VGTGFDGTFPSINIEIQHLYSLLGKISWFTSPVVTSSTNHIFCAMRSSSLLFLLCADTVFAAVANDFQKRQSMCELPSLGLDTGELPV
jgi:hypothetical protein